MVAPVTFSGLASGIDSSALIKAILDQERSTRVKPLTDKVSELTDVNTSLDKLSSLLTALQGAAGKFRLVNGGALAKNATSSDESVLSVAASNAAVNGSATVVVSQLARGATHSFNDRFGSDTQAINAGINDGDSAANRTVSYTVGTGANQETVDIVLTSTTTVADFVNAFNESSSLAQASLVNVGTASSPSYAVVVSSNESGTAEGQLNVSAGSAITGAGSFGTETSNQALDAEFSVSGISGTITRSSNSINDVIAGVTLNLQGTGTSTLAVSNDTQRTTGAVQDFVDAYNDIVKYIADNDTIERQDDGKNVTNVFGPLAHTSLDDNVLASLRQALSGSGTTGGTVNILADLGVTTNRDGTLAFDTAKLSTALTSDSNGVGTILGNLGESLASVDGTIAQFVQFNGLIGQAKFANDSEIGTLQNRSADAEKRLSQEEAALTARYAHLESIIGQLNSQQSALTSLLPR